MTQLQVQANINSSLKQMLWLVSFSNFMLQSQVEQRCKAYTNHQCHGCIQLSPRGSPRLQKEIRKSDASEHIHNYKARSEATSFLL